MSDCRKCAKFEECAVDEDCGLFVDKLMTNADRIRQMSDEEMARYYAKRIVRCYGCEAVTEDNCFECQLDWLKARWRADNG